MSYTYATGRRKNAIAKVRLKASSESGGKVIVNGMDLKSYFERDSLVILIEQPLIITKSLGNFDIIADCFGGGKSGQAGALRLGISRVLIKINEDFRSIVKKRGFLTRDPRMKERKKYGLAGARKKYQFSKR